MKQLLFMEQWGWKTSGTALGLVIVLAVVLVKPIGVSTQYVVLDGILWNAVNSELIQTDESAKHGYTSTNAYLNKDGGKYAKAIAEPFSYGLIFVISMFAGGFLAANLRTNSAASQTRIKPGTRVVLTLTRQQRFGDSLSRRYGAALVGGVLVLFGARLAGGCTSGHMMSGMMQTSFSGYVFTIAAFVAAIPAALLLYRNKVNSSDASGAGS